VIGTGASAIQFVPEIAPAVEQLHVFQRTAQWIMPKVDRAYRAEELRRFERVPFAARMHRYKIYWRNERMTSFHLSDKRSRTRTDIARAHLEREVQDPVLRQALMPDYPIGCKRLLLSNRWYPALTRPNVEVVTEKISHVTRSGIVTADGVERPLDVIILGTGFKATSYLGAIDVYGRSGRRLRDEWSDGAEAYLGMSVSGYPNLFMLYGPNTNQGGNSIIFILEAQVHYVMSAIRHMMRRGVAALDVRKPVMDRFNRRIQRDMEGTIWDGGCTTYYMDASGKITTQWPYRSLRYWALTRRMRPSDFDETPAAPSAS
jgi:cation diffusion facilitator CzcD-associated flavoprotein CzcO